MSNSFFQFKKFRIEQDKCAMKVCTDSCMFGAYIKIDKEVKKILDIGTGTGLLSLMLIQKYPIIDIDAVEIEPAAAEQASINIAASQWKDKIKVYKQSIQEFAPVHQYDLIVSNPPFFSNHLTSPDKKINTAHHNETLSLDELLISAQRLLKKDGKLWVLLPPYEAHLFITKAELINLQLQEKVTIQDNPGSEAIRIILLFSFTKNNYAENNFIIKDEKGKYSQQFVSLLKDYYLYLD